MLNRRNWDFEMKKMFSPTPRIPSVLARAIFTVGVLIAWGLVAYFPVIHSGEATAGEPPIFEFDKFRPSLPLGQRWSLRLYGDGKVTYVGSRSVKEKGPIESKVSQETISKFMQELESLGVFRFVPSVPVRSNVAGPGNTQLSGISLAVSLKSKARKIEFNDSVSGNIAFTYELLALLEKYFSTEKYRCPYTPTRKEMSGAFAGDKQPEDICLWEKRYTDGLRELIKGGEK